MSFSGFSYEVYQAAKDHNKANSACQPILLISLRNPSQASRLVGVSLAKKLCPECKDQRNRSSNSTVSETVKNMSSVEMLDKYLQEEKEQSKHKGPRKRTKGDSTPQKHIKPN